MNNTAALILYAGDIDKDHLRSVQGLMVNGIQSCSLHDHPLVDQARSYLSSFALRMTTADVLVWIDDDIVFNPTDVAKLAEQCRNGHPIIGAAYSARAPGGMIIGGGKEGDHFTFFEGGGIYPVSMLGMGFTAVHRSVYEKIGTSLPDVHIRGIRDTATSKPYFANLIENGSYYGEDASFCLLATRAGFQPEVDTTIRVQHKGQYLYNIEDALAAVPRQASVTFNFARKP